MTEGGSLSLFFVAHHSPVTLAGRAKLEGLVKELLERTKQPCHQCMKDAGVTPKDIQEVRGREQDSDRSCFGPIDL